MNEDLDWNLVRAFAAVGQTGSLTAAAERLGTSQPTVGRQLRALEAALGVPLIQRHARGVELTEPGRALLAEAEAVEDGVRALVRRARDAREAPRGTVRLTASEMVGGHILPALLREVRAAYPEIQLVLVLDERPTDVLRGEADVAVRMFRPRTADLVARKVGVVPLGLFAHKDYLARAGVPVTLDDLAHHATLGFDRSPIARVMADLHPALASERCAFRCDSMLGSLEALRAGLGVGVAQVEIARRDPGLVEVLAEVDSPLPRALEVWVAMHQDARAGGPERAVFDALVEGLTAYCERAARLRGG